MMSDPEPIRLDVNLPGHERVRMTVPPEQGAKRLSTLLLEHGLPISLGCGGSGICTNCRVKILHGSVWEEGVCHQGTGGPGDLVRSCRSTLTAPRVEIEIPERSLIGTVETEDELPLSVVAPNAEPLQQEPVACFDVGTTTVALALVDPASREVLFRASCFNRQSAYGADVMSRIHAANAEPDLLAAMQNAVLHQSFLPLLESALAKGHPAPTVAVATGNPTMMHLLAGDAPLGLAAYPFSTGFLAPQTLTLSPERFGLPFDRFHLLPASGPYFGSDIVAGAFALGLHAATDNALLLDLGTNGEMLLATPEGAIATSTAAGPAFEGRGLLYGMKAVPGAVRRVTAEQGELVFDTGGKQEPLGLCGTGYLDFIAEAKRLGFINEMGKMRPHPAVRNVEHGKLFVVAEREGDAIGVSETDIALLLQAKAAVGSATRILLDRAGIAESDVHRVIVAGGFGQSVRRESLEGVGMIPRFPNAEFVAVGNSSLAGAVTYAFDRRVRTPMQTFAESIRMVELNLQEEFEDEFIDALPIP